MKDEFIKNDKMISLGFENLLPWLLQEYRLHKTLFMVPVFENKKNISLGVAAGPHTQMAQNIVSCFATGASVIELKTVQVIDGENLKVEKPCISTGFEVFNIEWSTELTVEQAAKEYIKAYILIELIGAEFGLESALKIQFFPSVGYDLKGIKSEKIDRFINVMKNFSLSEEWKSDFEFAKNNLSLFENLGISEIEKIEKNQFGCKTFTLSTMHGCPADEIEKIAKYLLEEKNVNVFVKMNPTLSGKENVGSVLSSKGYSLEIPDDVYNQNIDLKTAVKIVEECQKCANSHSLKFGVKMTNTLPVLIKNKELAGERMYMSGPVLFPLAVLAVQKLCENLPESLKLEVSFSGGADKANVAELFECGIGTVTVCSALLKAGGYKNLSKILLKAEEAGNIPEKISLEKLKLLVQKSEENLPYGKKPANKIEPKENYSPFCAKCTNCVDVCPNRANIPLLSAGKKIVVNFHQFCNECGECAYLCPMGHKPYLEKHRESKSELLGGTKYEF